MNDIRHVINHFAQSKGRKQHTRTWNLSDLIMIEEFTGVLRHSCVYAQTMVERGFVALALDPAYAGERSGEPRIVASPDVNKEDFSAAVDFFGLQKNVDKNRIGIIGFSGFAGTD